MGSLYDNLKDYFENTPKEILDRDLKEVAHLNDIGPDVIEYAESVKENFAGKEVVASAPNKQNTHRFRWVGMF